MRAHGTENMTQFQGALVSEGGVTFALMIVKERVMDNPGERVKASAWGSMFFRVPTILVSDRLDRTYGRSDILPKLQGIDIAHIFWRVYTVAA